MIAVGLGLRPGTERVEIRTCIEAALGRLDLDLSDVGCLATVASRAAEPGLMAVAAAIGAPVIGIPDEALRGQDAGCATRSTRIVSLFGVGSVAEAAALAAAGASARLILPRIVMGRVTCALARGNRP